MPGYCFVKARPITSAVSVSTWAIYQVSVASLRAPASSAAVSALAPRGAMKAAPAAQMPAVASLRVMVLDIGLFPGRAARALAAAQDVMPEMAGLTRPAARRTDIACG